MLCPYGGAVLDYAPLLVRVTTPRIELVGATDALLEELLPLVRDGQAAADPPPYDDPMSLYEQDPTARVDKWLQAAWRARGSATADSWRLAFAVVVEGRPVGMQDLIGIHFETLRTVTSFSWLAAGARGTGVGSEMRQAILHLAFAGLDAAEATSDAFADNIGSNRVSEKLGYRRNGIDWATRQGAPGVLQRWRLPRSDWMASRRTDIALHGVDDCKAALGLS